MASPGRSPDTSWLPAGMDPKSSYLLKIRLAGNPKKRRKEFSCFHCSKVVDSDLCNFKDLVEEIVDQYPHGYNERVHVFYYDDVQNTFPKVTTDQELLEMFSKHIDSKVVRMTIAYSDPTDDVPIPEGYTPKNLVLDAPGTPSLTCPSLLAASQITEPSTSQPTKPAMSQSTNPSMSLPTEPTVTKPSTDQANDDVDIDNDDDDDGDGDDDYLANPQPQNEHVGVDEEGFYLTANRTVSEASDSESNSESDEEYEEEDGLIGEDPLPPMPIVAYDRFDPPMSVGSVYPSMREFKLALNQHAIKREFEYNIEKSDPGRLRAYCSRKKEEGCRWRIHASTMKDNITMSPYFFNKHWTAMEEAMPEAMNYIRQCHTRIWARSQFWTLCKVDYITNNLAECFNNWVKKYKGLNLDDLMDKIRQLIMNKWDVRRTVSQKFGGIILPHIMKELKEQSYNLDMEVQRSGDILGEVSVKGGSGFKCVVNLDERTCSCRKWQITGIPCKHAIAFITSIREPLEKYVDKYYSVEKFRAAYESFIPAMPDKDQWPESHHGFFMHPPLLKSTAGRRHTQRFKGCVEAGGTTTRKKGSHQCPICKGYGHRWYNCKNGDPADIAAMLAEKGPPKRRKKTIEPSWSSIVPIDSTPKTMCFPPSQSASASLGSQSFRSGHGSNQLSIEYPPPSLGETTPPPATSKPREDKKKPKVKANTQGKKKKNIQVMPDSPAMATRSKTPLRQSPAAHTRSKRKLPDLNL